MTRIAFLSFILATSALLLISCAQQEPQGDGARKTPKVKVADPLPQSASYYEQGTLVNLDKRKPEESTGLHNVYHLSKNIISGSEPHGEAALAHLKEMGVKTVLSVDGMPPEADLAAKYGLRYVHVPIQYSGMHEVEIKEIAKTFNDLEGPFYVHCFHGKHRGPAAAAIGRLVLDGTSRETALAEMRQWCGTSKKYEGLYRTVATAPLPDQADLAKYDFDFPAVKKARGIVPLMSQIARAHDNVFDRMGDDFAADPSHPDIDALNEAKKLHAFLKATAELAAEDKRPEDFQNWAQESSKRSKDLVEHLIALKSGDKTRIALAKDAFNDVKTNCGACHKPYRDN